MEFEIEEADSQHAHSLPKVCRCEKATKTQTIKSRTCLKKKQTPTSKARTCLVEKPLAKVKKVTMALGAMRAWPSQLPSLADTELRVGTHFSGWETCCQSLRATQIPHRLVMACDSNQHCRRIIKQNFQPELLYGDIGSRPMDSLPAGLDVYVSGSPCPSFSRAAACPTGIADDRGKLIYKQSEFINTCNPKTFLLEQVSTFKTLYPKVFKDYIRLLGNCGRGYNVSWKQLQTRKHGLPQNRERIYIAGIRSDLEQTQMFWPKGMELADNLSKILDSGATPNIDIKKETKSVQKSFQWANKRAKENGLDFEETSDIYALDARASEKYRHLHKNYTPTVTKARGACGGFVLLSRGLCRWLSMVESGKLQGTDISRLNLTGISRTQLGMMVGNAMSRNIMDRVLPRLLHAASLIRTLPKDKWADGELPF